MSTRRVDADAWKARYSACLVDEGGLPRAEADAAAESAVLDAASWLSPEDAARDEMTYWCEG